MKMIILAAVILEVYLAVYSPNLRAQTCQEEEGAVTAVKQDLTGMVGTIQKESLDDFQKHFHQQAFASRLSICLQTISDLLGCLDKASHDPAATKAQMDAIKAKQAAYQKLQTDLQDDSQLLKSAKNAKTAKSQIEKFVFTS
ncbi:MAG TPA: hypothetical protein VKV79_05060 [Terriglobia bacterium]|nr:hypothetical protein [Terriglobia bacterium]